MSSDPESLAQLRRVPFWLDAPATFSSDPLANDAEVDLLVVGAGFTGLWTALQALERDPSRSVMVLDADVVAGQASGRNGGFCVASLTHGLGNGLTRWPEEMQQLTRLGDENLDAIEATVARFGMDVEFERTGELTVAYEQWQVDELQELAELAGPVGSDEVFLDQAATQAKIAGPNYLGSLFSPRGAALIHPAKMAWELARVVRELGGIIHESTPVSALRRSGTGVQAQTPHGTVQAKKVLLATNAARPLLRRMRPYIVPVWDHVLMTEPLSEEQLASIGWSGREGVGDAGNQFHYFRLSADNRILWGGYDAHYYYGSDRDESRSANPQTERALAEHFFEAFPQLHGVKFTHAWGGAIDTSTRFCAYWHSAMGGRVVGVQGFTGLGVGASRFAGGVGLDLLDGIDSEATRLRMVREKPWPLPPEPVRWLGIQFTRRAIAKADANSGKRGPWLRLLDALGLGFDS